MIVDWNEVSDTIRFRSYLADSGFAGKLMVVLLNSLIPPNVTATCPRLLRLMHLPSGTEATIFPARLKM
jgi:hypothetical protein